MKRGPMEDQGRCASNVGIRQGCKKADSGRLQDGGCHAELRTVTSPQVPVASTSIPYMALKTFIAWSPRAIVVTGLIVTAYSVINFLKQMVHHDLLTNVVTLNICSNLVFACYYDPCPDLFFCFFNGGLLDLPATDAPMDYRPGERRPNPA